MLFRDLKGRSEQSEMKGQIMNQSDQLGTKYKNFEQPSKKPKKSLSKRFWWVILVAIFLGIGLSILIYAAIDGNIHDREMQALSDKVKTDKNNSETKTEDQYYWASKMSDAQLEKANKALSQGIKIDDPQNDFYHPTAGTIQGDGRPDNTDPYSILFTDLKSFSTGADNENLYFKYEFWGEFPQEAFSYNGELIHGIGVNIWLTFVNTEGAQDNAELSDCVIYVDKVGQDPTKWQSMNPRVLHELRLSPIGLDEKGETIYKKEDNSNSGAIIGGPGFNYFESYYPLSIFGIEYGDKVLLAIITETGSATFHHEAADFLLDQPDVIAKAGATIEYVLGSNTYKNLGVAKEMIKEEKK